MTFYFDLDGVLTDFVKQCQAFNCFKKNGKPNWDKIDSLGRTFWSQMDWIPGSRELFQQVEAFAKKTGWKIKVLSSIHSQAGKEGKIEWCQKNLGLSKSNIKIVPGRRDKVKYANPLSILIDDKEDIVNSFMYAGGSAILYDSPLPGSKRIDYLLQAMEKLYKKEPERINDASYILEERLLFLIQKLVKSDPESYYSESLFQAYFDIDYWTSGYLNFSEIPGSIDKWPDKFESIFLIAYKCECQYEKIMEKKEVLENNHSGGEKFPPLKIDELSQDENRIHFPEAFHHYLEEFTSKGEKVNPNFINNQKFVSKVCDALYNAHDIKLNQEPDFYNGKYILSYIYLLCFANFLLEKVIRQDL